MYPLDANPTTGPVADVHYVGLPTARWESVARRAVDLVVAGLGLLVFALPMVAIALLIRLTNRGPALFRQRSLDRLRRQIVRLSPKARAKLLVPLRHDFQEDTRHIAALLAEQLDLPIELTPAVAPAVL